MTTSKRKTVLSFAIGLGLLAVLLHLVDFGHFSAAGTTLRNALHTPSFAVLTVVFAILLEPLVGRFAVFVAGLAAIAVGVLAEVAQFAGAGQPSVVDLLRDAVGIGIGVIVLILARRIRRDGWQRWAALAVVSGALVAALLPTLNAGYPFAMRRWALPSLLSVDAAWSDAFWLPSNAAAVSIVAAPTEWPGNTETILRIDLADSDYSGIRLEPFRDWRGYDALSFDIATGDGRSHELTLRIDDVDHDLAFTDRLNHRFAVTPNPVSVRVPLDAIRSAPAGRAMRLEEIQNLMIFKANPDGSEVLLLGDIRLE